MSKSKEFEKKWKTQFKWGKSGTATGNAIAVEFEGVVYDTLNAASEATGKTTNYIKKHGKILK